MSSDDKFGDEHVRQAIKVVAIELGVVAGSQVLFCCLLAVVNGRLDLTHHASARHHERPPLPRKHAGLIPTKRGAC